MSFTKSPPWRNPVAIGISSPSGRGDTAPDNPLDNPLECEMLILSLCSQPMHVNAVVCCDPYWPCEVWRATIFRPESQ